MNINPCLVGPAFAISGSTVYTDQLVSFQTTFNSVDDELAIKAYQWYLNDTLIVNQNSKEFNQKINYGTHVIGVRILSLQGWSGIKTILFTCYDFLSSAITGPNSLQEGTSGTYNVIGTTADGATLDITNLYSFSSPAGSFTGNLLSVPSNGQSGDGYNATITATKTGSNPLVFIIAIIDANVVNPSTGVLVVDIYNDESLNLIALIDNAQVSENHVAAYTGNNFVPVTTAANALMLASDLIPQTTLKWRFEFNLNKLVNDYPAVSEFVFFIKGRGSIAGFASGAYSKKSDGTTMVMFGNPGTYLPSVTGGNSVGTLIQFTSSLVSGANGNYNESELTTIIKLIYHVSSRTVIHVTDGDEAN